ncbi:MAG: hypothetical protein ACHP84_07660 [Caulobacterales bacterium]
MTWVTHEADQLRIVAEIESQSDRGAALVAASFVDARLTEAISLRFDPNVDPTVRGRVLRGSGALATFSAKIDVGLMLSLYPPSVHVMLNKIRDIRNDFAHEVMPMSFQTPSVSDRCHNLLPVLVSTFLDAMDHYTKLEAHLGYPAQQHWYGTFTGEGVITGPHAARSYFMQAVKQSLMHLSRAMDVFGPHQLSPSTLPKMSA